MAEDEFSVYWQSFVDWFTTIPLYGQILVIVGALTIAILTVILVYYIIKGVAYLVYYILKGIYMLLKAIGVGFYRLCDALYWAISGKEKPIKEEKNDLVLMSSSSSCYLSNFSSRRSIPTGCC